MNKDIIISDLTTSTENFIKQLSIFTPENFNYTPSDKAWSAAQISEHLLKLEILANKIMRGQTVPTNRAADGKISMIKWAMNDVNSKRTAPEIVEPSGEYKDAEQLRDQIIKQRELIKEIIDTTDITDACMSGKHPALGTLTKLEWIYFIIYHTQRHLQQMKTLEDKILHPE